MLDFSWQELAVTGVVALVVLGPKELPTLMHTAGKFVRKARLVLHDFQMSMDEMGEEIELEEYRKDALKKAEAIEPAFVTPAQAGVHDATPMDSGLRRNDGEET